MSQHPAWLMVIGGLILAGAGLLWLMSPSVPWLGRMPGDVNIQRENVRVHFPVVTCLLISIVLSAAMWLVRFFSK